MNDNLFACGLAEELVDHVAAVNRIERVTDDPDLSSVGHDARSVLPNRVDVWSPVATARFTIVIEILLRCLSLVRERQQRFPAKRATAILGN